MTVENEMQAGWQERAVVLSLGFWSQPDLDSNPGSATNLLCDLGPKCLLTAQFELNCSVSLSVKWG